MDALWPWLAVAGGGALHGLNPASGWLPAAACGLRSGDRIQALRALVPIAAGHVLAVALVGAVLAFNLAMDRGLAQALAAVLLVAVLLTHCSGRAPDRMRAPAGQAGLALWSFMVSTAHGAGLMLVPALAPLCARPGLAGVPAAWDPWLPALAAVGVHTAAMLAVTGLLALGACRGTNALRGLLRSCKRGRKPPLGAENGLDPK